MKMPTFCRGDFNGSVLNIVFPISLSYICIFGSKSSHEFKQWHNYCIWCKWGFSNKSQERMFIFLIITQGTVYPKKYAHGFCFAVLCCGYTLTDFPISIRLTSLALWQSNDCPSASKATLMNMVKYFMWIHYERLHNHNKAKHNNLCIFLGIYCICLKVTPLQHN